MVSTAELITDFVFPVSSQSEVYFSGSTNTIRVYKTQKRFYFVTLPPIFIMYSLS